MAKLCENSRSLSSALSHDEESSSSAEPRSRYARSRSNSTLSRSTPNPGTRKNSKASDEIMELAKTVQDGMADLTIYDEDFNLKSSPDELQSKMEAMKTELMNKIKNEEPPSRKASALRRNNSTEESIEEQSETEEQERPKSRGRRNSNVSFLDSTTVEESVTTVAIHQGEMDIKRQTSSLERKIAGKPIEKYCKDIIQDIEKSSQVIDKHVKNFNQSRFENDKLVQQLEAVDKINEFVNANGEIPESALNELNNNFQMLTDQVFTDVIPTGRKRSLSSRKSSRESRANLLGDANMTNQQLLDELLGKN